MSSKKIRLLILSLILFIVLVFSAFALGGGLEVNVYPANEVQGTGPLPYNYRVINNWLHAGGHPFNPATEFKNSDAQVKSILSYLKSQGVATIIDLSGNPKIEARYQKLLKEVGINKYMVTMTAEKLPTKKEWVNIKSKFRKPVYIHCKWGADRTGAVIGRYLVEEKGYFPDEAYAAVITGGGCAGALGGLKQDWEYRKLKIFISKGVEE